MYYAADVCYAEKVAQEKRFFHRLTSRYRHYAAFERATFDGKADATINADEYRLLTSKNIIRLPSPKRSVSIFFSRDLPDRK